MVICCFVDLALLSSGGCVAWLFGFVDGCVCGRSLCWRCALFSCVLRCCLSVCLYWLSLVWCVWLFGCVVSLYSVCVGGGVFVF